jgi:hypothetical protein
MAKRAVFGKIAPDCLKEPFMTPRMLALSAALACAITPAWGSDLVTSVTRQLLKQGYSDITTSQTWLGRTRIIAIGEDSRREIIVNPRTGEILRDFWQDIDDDDDDDDDNDDDDDDGENRLLKRADDDRGKDGDKDTDKEAD